MASAKFYGTGRRKKSIARVYLVPGTGNITINKRDIDEYLGLETLKVVVRQPLVATGTTDKNQSQEFILYLETVRSQSIKEISMNILD